MNLPISYFRCEGATSRQYGERVLCHPCIRCARRTASRDHDRITWLTPPAKFPCAARIDVADVEEMYV